MSCCVNTYNLGCFEHCKNVSFFSSTYTGLIQIVYSVIDTNKVVEFEAIENEPIIFDLSVLNENTNYSISIFDENGNKKAFNIGGINYDCFKIKTKIYNSI